MSRMLLLLLAMSCGVVITYIDSRPNWDDTGITALAILVVCGVFASAKPNQWWLRAIAVGLWIPLLGIAREQKFASLLALVVDFIGAIVGNIDPEWHIESAECHALTRTLSRVVVHILRVGLDETVSCSRSCENSG